FAAAERTLDALGVAGLALASRAGRASSLVALGRVEEARALIGPVLDAVHADDLGGAHPEPVWLAALRVLDAADDPAAGPFRAEVLRRVEERARRVGAAVEPEYRRAPAVRALVDGG
ncbi:hypothetical protein, partial [Phycicoccus avicenniae]|uniref:hypothetical protein n=1 Tax=Phycicoccus avicenniae TaxID=2828860 RepID=UPI003D2ACDE9